MQKLVTAGLYEANLLELLSLVRQSFKENPAVHGTLTYIFESLINEGRDEFSGQGWPAERYNLIVERLTEPLLKVLDAKRDPPGELLDKLDRLHLAFFNL
ncbi:MAG: hypothetical protein WA655_00940 [Candidatus Korobacteraceae bacterium]